MKDVPAEVFLEKLSNQSKLGKCPSGGVMYEDDEIVDWLASD